MPLDPTLVQQLRSDLGGDEAAWNEIVTGAVKELPDLLRQAREAAAAGNAAELRRAAHTIKSLGRMFGDAALTSECLSAEQKAAAGDVAGASALLPKIAQLSEATARDLAALVG